jgi:hypothetical protein
MAQIHYVVLYDTESEQWRIDTDPECLLPDGAVWDWAGSQEWQPIFTTVGVDEYGEGEKNLRHFLSLMQSYT